MNPLLSICIPTYNRCTALKASLEVMTSDPEFIKNDQIEIVISDNASPDETQNICESFVKRFPDKIVYYRQPANKGYSANLEQLTRIARGEYLKFINDCLAFTPGVLKDIFNLVKDNLNHKCVLFWGGDDFAIEAEQGIIQCNSADEFLKISSHATTWIGAYGFWRLDIDETLEVGKKYADTLIPQTAVFWHLFAKYGRALVYHKLMVCQPYPQKVRTGNYNFAEVFGKNYLGILKEYKNTVGISSVAYEAEKKKVYRNIVFPWYFDFKNTMKDSPRGGFFMNTIDFHQNFYYWLSLVFWPLSWMKARVALMLPTSYMKVAYKIYKKLSFVHW